MTLFTWATQSLLIATLLVNLGCKICLLHYNKEKSQMKATSKGQQELAAKKLKETKVSSSSELEGLLLHFG
jgi:hypothetical protein